MKFCPFVLSFLFAATALSAQNTEQRTVWQPSPGHTQVAIWPGTPPDLQKVDSPEYLETTTGPKDLVAGKPVAFIYNVTRPTLTVYSPTAHNTGAAVVVFPGGGYQILAIDLEGTEVCDWLVRKGITCVLLKYRVPAGHTTQYYGGYPESPIALEDAQRAIGLVRFHADDWHIDPHRVGVLGFSAGGHLVAATSVHAQRIYAPVDAADKLSCRPDFAIAIYPGHLSYGDKELTHPKLNPDIAAHLTKNAPPTFILQNEDDNVDGINQALVYYIALKNAGVPAEMHIYAQGGHAFGLRPTKLPATHWPALVETWLGTIGVLPQ
ncbi:MAG TPA: alpha/beta hydrolase [Acidobacteriaceae bacterium]|nr:alpha/beta hydrolase [Acidobacteriaceae bacterium]